MCLELFNQKHEMGTACSKYGKDKKYIKNAGNKTQSENLTSLMLSGGTMKAYELRQETPRVCNQMQFYQTYYSDLLVLFPSN
jgi:hypothetical protein